MSSGDFSVVAFELCALHVARLKVIIGSLGAFLKIATLMRLNVAIYAITSKGMRLVASTKDSTQCTDHVKLIHERILNIVNEFCDKQPPKQPPSLPVALASSLKVIADWNALNNTQRQSKIIVITTTPSMTTSEPKPIQYSILAANSSNIPVHILDLHKSRDDPIAITELEGLNNLHYVKITDSKALPQYLMATICHDSDSVL
mmetsp:Transcript_9898/g.10986  ORF Transcript_9898/g.10986 Transcript_9898/m.10986 type:complete len:203 (-) Transcript_9898:242-850(-)